jgi:uncharacterized protein (UPF0335 family)
MTDPVLVGFVERLNALAEQYKEDVAAVIKEAKEQEIDAPALRRLAAYMRKDELTRLEQEAIDDQYRFLAGVAASPAELPDNGEVAQAAALFADSLSIRAVAKEMGVSVGKAHKLKSLAAMFTVHRAVNMNAPDHDAETGEITESSGAGASMGASVCAQAVARPLDTQTAVSDQPGDDTRTPEPSRSAEVVANPSPDLTIPDFLRRAV